MAQFQHKIFLINWKYPKDGEYRRYFSTLLERDKYFEKLTPYYSYNVNNINWNDGINVKIKINLDNPDLFINQELNNNYCIIKSTNLSDNKVNYSYYYINSTAHLSQTVTLNLELDDFVNNFIETKFNECLINRTHLNRFKEIDSDDNNKRFTFWDSLSSPIAPQPIDSHPLILKQHEKINFLIDESTSSDPGDNKTLNKVMFNSDVSWVLIYLKSLENKEKFFMGERGILPKAVDFLKYRPSRGMPNTGYYVVAMPIYPYPLEKDPKPRDDYYKNAIHVRTCIRNEQNFNCQDDVNNYPPIASFSFFDKVGLTPNIMSVKYTNVCPFIRKKYKWKGDGSKLNEDLQDVSEFKTSPVFIGGTYEHGIPGIYRDDTTKHYEDYRWASNVNYGNNNTIIFSYRRGEREPGTGILLTIWGSLFFIVENPNYSISNEFENHSYLDLKLSDIKGSNYNRTLNPVSHMDPIKRLEIVNYENNSVIYDFWKLSVFDRKKLTAKIIETTNIDMSTQLLVLNDIPFFSYYRLSNYNLKNSLITSIDNTYPYSVNQLDIYMANNKNWDKLRYLGVGKNILNSLTSVLLDYSNPLKLAANLSTSALGIGSNYLSNSLNLGNLDRNESSSREGNVIFNVISNHKRALLQSVNTYEIDQKIKNSIVDEYNLYGFWFNRYDDPSNYFESRKYFNYVKFNPTFIDKKLSSIAQQRLFDLCRKGIILVHTDNLDMSKENYERWLDNV